MIDNLIRTLSGEGEAGEGFQFDPLQTQMIRGMLGHGNKLERDKDGKITDSWAPNFGQYRQPKTGLVYCLWAPPKDPRIKGWEPVAEVPWGAIEALGLKVGDICELPCSRQPREVKGLGTKYQGLKLPRVNVGIVKGFQDRIRGPLLRQMRPDLAPTVNGLEPVLGRPDWRWFSEKRNETPFEPIRLGDTDPTARLIGIIAPPAYGHKILLVSPAGSGKSTWVRKFVVNAINHNDELPIYLVGIGAGARREDIGSMVREIEDEVRRTVATILVEQYNLDVPSEAIRTQTNRVLAFLGQTLFETELRLDRFGEPSLNHLLELARARGIWLPIVGYRWGLFDADYIDLDLLRGIEMYISHAENMAVLSTMLPLERRFRVVVIFDEGARVAEVWDRAAPSPGATLPGGRSQETMVNASIAVQTGSTVRVGPEQHDVATLTMMYTILLEPGSQRFLDWADGVSNALTILLDKKDKPPTGLPDDLWPLIALEGNKIRGLEETWPKWWREGAARLIAFAKNQRNGNPYLELVKLLDKFPTNEVLVAAFAPAEHRGDIPQGLLLEVAYIEATYRGPKGDEKAVLDTRLCWTAEILAEALKIPSDEEWLIEQLWRRLREEMLVRTPLEAARILARERQAEGKPWKGHSEIQGPLKIGPKIAEGIWARLLEESLVQEKVEEQRKPKGEKDQRRKRLMAQAIALVRSGQAQSSKDLERLIPEIFTGETSLIWSRIQEMGLLEETNGHEAEGSEGEWTLRDYFDEAVYLIQRQGEQVEDPQDIVRLGIPDEVADRVFDLLIEEAIIEGPEALTDDDLLKMLVNRLSEFEDIRMSLAGSLGREASNIGDAEVIEEMLLRLDIEVSKKEARRLAQRLRERTVA